MKTIDKILYRMKREGPVTAKILAEEFQLTTMGVRQHLQGLEEDGLVDFEDIKAKVGRPTRHWHLTQKGHRRFADRHGDLIIQMLDSVEELFGQEGLGKVVDRREDQTFEQYQAQLAGVENIAEKLQILTTLREREGYMAELHQDGEDFVLIENHCPICHAAQRCPSLCQSELAVFQRLLGNEYQVNRQEHIIAGERRCAYRIIKS
ncbi:helix-turn-helix transcriptional regulator [Photobacterium rosenbergii]|uniref:Metalloregulator ArsR/SmtB family transcription factor n=1 Tax=Photobacterium rosenbergii TaxID=294936 RepID=A0A2T3NCU7_9GAMM|nr:metalloregulator ArsR/SmtB family transcription factor [Photobacterium rosenbergii]MDV5171266.1 metalloregulator ArsR/SmtB family transcription factor [Photobacterium rosenbergii]PSW11853.1 transcriptional regulator [Photobacterium rosenbergii]